MLGADCRIGAHASLSHALLGARVYIYPGARIGQEGFGFATTAATASSPCRSSAGSSWRTTSRSAPTARSTAARSQDTVIGAGSRLDNLVQIGHNVRLGRCCVIVAQAGISGSTVLEDFVHGGGQAGLTGHLRIGREGADRRAGRRDGGCAGRRGGGRQPGQPVREFFRQVATLRRLAARRARGRQRRGRTRRRRRTDDGLSGMDTTHAPTGRDRAGDVDGWSTSRASCTRSRTATRS